MAPGTTYRFRLYVAGEAQNSTLALANLTAICQAWLPGRYDIDVVDVFMEPERTFQDGVFMTPTLLRLQPAPRLRIVGTLSDSAAVVQALGLAPLAA